MLNPFLLLLLITFCVLASANRVRLVDICNKATFSIDQVFAKLLLSGKVSAAARRAQA